MKKSAVKTSDYQQMQDQSTGLCPASIIVDAPWGNKRRNRSKQSFEELKQAIIAEGGINQSITVRPSKIEPGKLEMIAGYGRRDIGMELDILVPYVLRQVDDKLALRIHLSENRNREDLSLVDDVLSTKEYMTLFGGDLDAVASEMNRPVKTIREWLELNKCTEQVLAALEVRKISAGHAIVFAPFTTDRQNSTLEKCIEQSWTVKELRIRADKVLIPLKEAKFCTLACQDCEFNTERQLGLFDDISTKASCAKSSCFSQKTSAWLEQQRQLACEKYGTVLFLSKTDNSQINITGITAVGKTQFNQCRQCKNRIAVMDDSPGMAGAIMENVCIDAGCFSKCKTQFEKDKQKGKPTASVDKTVAIAEMKSSATSIAGTKTATVKEIESEQPITPAALSLKVTDYHKALARKAAAQLYQDDKHFYAAVMAAALLSHSGYRPKDCKANMFSSLLVYLLTNHSHQDLQHIATEAIGHLLTSQEIDNDQNSITETLIGCLKISPEQSRKALIKQWSPSDENLGIYTVDTLMAIGKEAGVDKVLDKAGPDSFNKLGNKRKAEVITTLRETDINWESFAPGSLLSFVKERGGKHNV